MEHGVQFSSSLLHKDFQLLSSASVVCGYDQNCTGVYQGGFFSEQSCGPLCLRDGRSGGESDGGNGQRFSRLGWSGLSPVLSGKSMGL